MKIPGAYFQMVNYPCTNFSEYPCTHFAEYAWKKSCPKKGDRQTDDRGIIT